MPCQDGAKAWDVTQAAIVPPPAAGAWALGGRILVLKSPPANAARLQRRFQVALYVDRTGQALYAAYWLSTAVPETVEGWT